MHHLLTVYNCLRHLEFTKSIIVIEKVFSYCRLEEEEYFDIVDHKSKSAFDYFIFLKYKDWDKYVKPHVINRSPYIGLLPKTVPMSLHAIFTELPVREVKFRSWHNFLTPLVVFLVNLSENQEDFFFLET